MITVTSVANICKKLRVGIIRVSIAISNVTIDRPSSDDTYSRHSIKSINVCHM